MPPAPFVRVPPRRPRYGRPEAGFTLVELLIVIVVLGVLSGLVAGVRRSDLDGGGERAAVAGLEQPDRIGRRHHRGGDYCGGHDRAGGTTCAGAVSIDNSWPQGYQAAITVTDRGTTALTNWVASWTVPDGVTLNNGWNATVTQSGSRMRVQAPDWSTTLAPGASWAIGFIANGPFSPPPSAVALNGVSCA